MENQKIVIVPSELHNTIFRDETHAICSPGNHIVALSVKRIQVEYYRLLNVTVEGQEILNSENESEEIIISGEDLQFVSLVRGV